MIRQLFKPVYFHMPKHTADSGKYGYGISLSNCGSGYVVKAPLYRSDKQRWFKNLNIGRQWQLAMIRRHWGVHRFGLIKRGRLKILRSFGAGVSVRTTTSRTELVCGGIAEYTQWGVFWYDHSGRPKSKIFSYKRYGDDAELEANWFAAKQRAKLTESELNLPSHWTVETFENR